MKVTSLIERILVLCTNNNMEAIIVHDLLLLSVYSSTNSITSRKLNATFIVYIYIFGHQNTNTTYKKFKSLSIVDISCVSQSVWMSSYGCVEEKQRTAQLL